MLKPTAVLKVINDIFQFVSLLITSVLGITNLLIDYKDKKGHTTVYGRRALKAIIVSSIISVITFGLDRVIKHNEQIEDDKKTLESVNRSEKIITDINRGLNPIKDVLLSYHLVVDFNRFPELLAYKDRLKTGLAKLTPALLKNKTAFKMDGVTLGGFHGPADRTHYKYAVWQDSPLFPDKEKERFAYIAVMEQIAMLYFYQKPVPIRYVPDFPAFDGIEKTRATADLIMEFPADRHSLLYLDYDMHTDQLTIVAQHLTTDPHTWISSNNIIATTDLSNAQFYLEFNQAAVSTSSADDAKIVIPDMDTLSVTMSDGKRLAFNSQLKKYKFSTEVVYEYRFPANIDSLFRKNLVF